MGRIGKPMLTLHGTLDSLLPITTNSDNYAALIGKAGRGHPHRYYVRGQAAIWPISLPWRGRPDAGGGLRQISTVVRCRAAMQLRLSAAAPHSRSRGAGRHRWTAGHLSYRH